jgi:hypothetical protein
MHNLGDNALSTILGSALGSPQFQGQRFGNKLRVSIRLPKMLGSHPPDAHNLGVSHNLGDNALVNNLGVSALGSPQFQGQRFGNKLRVSIRLPKMLGSHPPDAHNLGVSHNLGDNAWKPTFSGLVFEYPQC